VIEVRAEEACAVNEGLKTTFEVLCRTENEAAVRTLIPAMDSPFAAIRDQALETLLKRRSPAGHREILARLHTFDDGWRAKVAENRSRLVPAFREAIISSDRQLCINACQAAVWLRQYDLAIAMTTGLEDPNHPNAAVLSNALLELAELLCEELVGRGSRADGGDVHFVRRRVVEALGTAVARFSKHRRREIVEAFLLLTYRDDAVLLQVLQDPYHAAFVALVDLLSKSPHEAVIGLLLSFLDDARPPSAAISVLSKRSDLNFLQRFLQKVGRDPSGPVARNLKRIETLPWAGMPAILDALNEQAQEAAVRLAMESAIPRSQAYALVEHVLRRGKPAGRRAAADALDQFRGVAANLAAMAALRDEDPEVQARILVQLRSRGIPGALAHLVEMIDSPHAVVRAAARQSLEEFTFPRYLATFDLLDDEVRESTGELVKKVDSQTVPLLQAELESKVRSRRLRGLAVARALRLVREVEAAIVPLLQDEDHLIRAEAAATLGQSRSEQAREALAEAIYDRSLAVREAARKSLGLPASEWAEASR
jgi:HEAT repeat protein